ncbi:lysophospholipid acyltransferase family protein [Limnohabitans sp. B9-3]|uniref:lysophospholipid acyltransferase family protein n=1 Tax=Limnohabitans sp. B9-3 TaxID=1100707 RepID=UPI000C1DCBA9|nr:lysophospholipid acyltransferase family protein [Limnohabitans sp. B9-3]PIT78949.1 lipid A biosynthesis acyltransferase [Limnohabitans sp. B9-3]
MFSVLGLWLLRGLGYLPLPWLRALGAGLGALLYGVVRSRRHVVLTNLSVCFPQWSAKEREALARQSFVHFAQAWLDRSWLWHRSAACIQSRVQLTGDVQALSSDEPTVLFAPHFVGLDVGWTRLTLSLPLHFTTIFTPQSNAAVDAWVAQGRQRFGKVRLFRREDGVKPIVSALRKNELLYLLPDMNFGPSESIFVPFFGELAATVPSLSRFAKLGRARVVPVITRMTDAGYEVVVHPAWTDFPSDDAEADTALMNQRLEGFIHTMPAQYFWVHKRFKTRPAGAPEIY